jgi:hypothetical protein
MVDWVKQDPSFNANGDNFMSQIAKDSSDNLYVSYISLGTVSGGTNQGSGDVTVFKMTNTGEVVWIKQHPYANTSVMDYVQSMVVDISGNVFIAYWSEGTVSGGTNLGYQDIILMKLDNDGDIVWLKQHETLNTTFQEQSPKMGVDGSGNIYVAYTSNGTVSGGTQGPYSWANTIVLAKLDNDGNVIWTIQNDSINPPFGNMQNPAIAVDYSGTIYLTCTIGGDSVSGGTNAGGYWDNAVFKFDTNGNRIWAKQTLDMNTADLDYYPTITFDTSGNIFVGYFTYGTSSGGHNSTAADNVVYKMDPDGNMVWSKQNTIMNTDKSNMDLKLVTDTSGNVYGTFYTDGTMSGGTTNGNQTIVVLKFDTDGNILWTIQDMIMNSQNCFYPSITTDSLNNIYVTYTGYGTVSGGVDSIGGQDIIVFKLKQSNDMTVPSIYNISTFSPLPIIAIVSRLPSSFTRPVHPSTVGHIS